MRSQLSDSGGVDNSSYIRRLDSLANEDPDTPGLAEAMTTVCGLQPGALRTYIVVLDNPQSTVSDLSDRLDSSYTNVHRQLRALQELELVNRERAILPSGGHEYSWTAQPLEETRLWLQDQFSEWREAVLDQAQELERAE
ncbi:helix-turn-helix domain-containing protein [Halococcus sp. IIIV-5B]|uniref:helix-turn-helix domain-containing protein n=1 Tax=Halococcus sp. IIIV-5B TaxID=2321230 RepID=UPI000E76498F|nr:helix-turn-helix domain-containing protein [Halococcus sp. IIIV-5B]RJT04764.1 TrmB family transcriptional regulator [Halococcus sp. IIIV-5B]